MADKLSMPSSKLKNLRLILSCIQAKHGPLLWNLIRKVTTQEREAGISRFWGLKLGSMGDCCHSRNLLRIEQGRPPSMGKVKLFWLKRCLPSPEPPSLSSRISVNS